MCSTFLWFVFHERLSSSSRAIYVTRIVIVHSVLNGYGGIITALHRRNIVFLPFPHSRIVLTATTFSSPLQKSDDIITHGFSSARSALMKTENEYYNLRKQERFTIATIHNMHDVHMQLNHRIPYRTKLNYYTHSIHRVHWQSIEKWKSCSAFITFCFNNVC
jgi:hypothetical protein